MNKVRSFSLGPRSGAQMAAGVLLPIILVPIRLRSVVVEISGIISGPTIVVRDGGGGIIWVALCGGVVVEDCVGWVSDQNDVNQVGSGAPTFVNIPGWLVLDPSWSVTVKDATAAATNIVMSYEEA